MSAHKVIDLEDPHLSVTGWPDADFCPKCLSRATRLSSTWRSAEFECKGEGCGKVFSVVR